MKLYTLDSETDPFLKGRTPQPFAWNLYDGTRHRTTWEAHCTEDIMQIVAEQESGLIYMHNGGKFDIFYLLPWIDTEKDMLIIKSRITQCYLKAAHHKHHRLRDSLKILPFSLDTYQKTKIDYRKFESDVRESHKTEIIEYLKDDCTFLYELVQAYFAEFGPSITIGGTAIKELKKFHYIGEPISADTDKALRSRYYFGGRVERYKVGVFPGEWQCYDVNSMYPFAMANYYHPIGEPSFQGRVVTASTYFLTVRGFSHGAFPLRTKTGVSFPHEHNIYSVSIHEWNAANELGLFECDEILECVDYAQDCMFDNYVNHFYGMRKKARLTQDKIREIFFKYLLNNSYGRFAINPESFREYRITDNETDLRFYGFSVDEIIEEFGLILWSKPSTDAKYSNISTSASITGAARAVLMRGVRDAIEPMYCDTDSIICRALKTDNIDAAKLGAWKLEKTGNSLAIAGRKMYALFNNSECVKFACKGVQITPEDIVKAANGEIILYEREAPTFRLNGNVDWITRKVRAV